MHDRMPDEEPLLLSLLNTLPELFVARIGNDPVFPCMLVIKVLEKVNKRGQVSVIIICIRVCVSTYVVVSACTRIDMSTDVSIMDISMRFSVAVNIAVGIRTGMRINMIVSISINMGIGISINIISISISMKI